jgi:hypothetical protein
MKRITLPLAIFLFFTSAYLVTFRGHYGSDQFMSYLTAESLVLDHSIAICVRNFNIADIQSNIERAPTGIDGRRYTLFSLVLPLAMIPLYLMGHLAGGLLPPNLHDYITMFFVSMTNVFITALTCTLLFRYLARLGYSSRTALIVTLLYGFGTMAWNYSQYSFAEPLLSLWFLFSLLMLEAWERADRFSGRAAWGLGLLLGLCLLTEVYAALIIVPAILLYIVLRLWRKRPDHRVIARTLLGLAVPLLAFVGILFWFYWLRFGGLAAPRLSGHLSLAFIPVSLYGFTLSAGKSFFLFVPPALLALYGVKSFYRRKRDLTIMLAGIAVISVLFISTYVEGWHGDYAWGPRYLFHLILMAMLPLAEVFERKLFATTWKHRAMTFLIMVSIIIQTGGILINTGNYIRFVESLQLGDRHFVPYLSAVPGHWFLVTTTVYRGLTGKTLTLSYPTGDGNPSWRPVDTTGFDGFDLWFVHLPQYWHSPYAVWIALISTLILVIAAGVFFRYIWRATAQPDHSTCCINFDHGRGKCI